MNKALTTILALSAGIISAFAATDDSLHVEMHDIRVVAVRERTIVKPQVLSDSILQRMNSQSVADALRYFTGVQVKDYGGIGGIKTVNIRSMGTNHVGVFYNGIQLGNAQNGQVDLGRYSLDNLASISLYNGQKSDIFQTARDLSSSSAIYITTRRPTFSDGKKHNLVVQFKTGSFGLVNPSVLWEYRISDKASLSANVEYTNANGRYKFRYKRKNLDGTVAYDTTATRKNGDVEALRTELAMYGLIHGGKWNVNGYFYTSDRGIPGAIVNNVFRHGERQVDKSAFGQGEFQKRISPYYAFRISGKFAWDYSNFLRNDSRELFVDNHYYQQEAYVSLSNLFTIKKWWRVSAAFDCQMNKMNADLADFAYPTRWTEYASVASSFDFSKFSAQASLLGTFIQESTRSRKLYTASPNKKELSPAIFFSYTPITSSDFVITGFFKRIFRMPTFNDLYYTEIGNANLLPEKTWQYDLGVAYGKHFANTIWESIKIRVDGYFNKVTDKIIAYPTGQQFRWTMINLGKVKIAGLETSIALDAKVGQVKLGTNLQYTYQRARDYTNEEDTFYGDQIPYTPIHSGSVAVRGDWKGWQLNYSFIYTGERYNEQENTRYNYEQPWYTHDMSISKLWHIRKFDLKATGEINNIFNQAYEVIHNYPMPGRNYKLSLRFVL